MGRDFFNYVHENPIIAALNDVSKLDRVLSSPSNIIFLLTGDIMNLEYLVNEIKKANKLVFVHIDLIEGLSRHPITMDYISEKIKPSGIISTKSNMIKKAKEKGIFAIQRIFMLDSLAFKMGKKSLQEIRPDAVEILPGLMPKIIKETYIETRVPVISGGLIRDKEDVIQGLNAGAIGISTSEESVWYM